MNGAVTQTESGLPWAKKIVNDTIIWAPTLEELQERATIILERPQVIGARKRNNFRRAHHQSSWHQTRRQQVPGHCRVFDANQCFSAEIISGLGQSTHGIRPGLSTHDSGTPTTSQKGTWTKDMQSKFERVKLLFTTTTTVQPFNPNLTSILMTDASRLFGIGFALLQPLPGEKCSLIQCGSASLTPTQTRYATIKLECMAIQWAIQKCSYYLRGLETFEVWIDHKPLVGIFQKSICDLDNPRLMRMRVKIMEYTPEVKWVPGKTHYIADALSRLPMFNTNNDDYTISCNYQSVESVWDSIKEGTKSAQ